MEPDPVRIYQRVVESLFDDGIINMGRVLTLYVYTKQFSHQNQQHTDRIWEIYRQALKGTGYEDITFGRKTDWNVTNGNQSECRDLNQSEDVLQKKLTNEKPSLTTNENVSYTQGTNQKRDRRL